MMNKNFRFTLLTFFHYLSYDIILNGYSYPELVEGQAR